MMRSTAALIEAASGINDECSRYGVHVKLFVSAEIFPHLADAEISNYSKFVRNPVYLHWRPRDLIRLVCWRINEYFRITPGYKDHYRDDIHWESARDVIGKIWQRIFGNEVKNGNGRVESTIGYVLRHTQLRPRQFVLFCNLVAKMAIELSTFPKITSSNIVAAVHEQERELAKEVINSYSHIYENIGKIVRALHRTPIVFEAKLLDKKAPSTSSEWVHEKYNAFRFREIMAELGIIGRVRQERVAEDGLMYIEADFDYAIDDQLHIQEDERCVIHPMFFSRLRTDTRSRAIVYPFPDHPDFRSYGLSRDGFR